MLYTMSTCVSLKSTASARMLPVRQTKNTGIELRKSTPHATGRLNSSLLLRHTPRAPTHLRRNITTAASGGYYEVIDGKKMDREMLAVAKECTQGKGDGRISLEDAKLLLETVKDGNKYTDIEKESMAYIRKTYKFTEQADAWFRKEIRSWATKKAWETRKKAAEASATPETKDAK
mmetsp:Transcript_31851/g.69572  ORF Transcript_31851/g.69572 Transcript_31851/m.69572 type:complete len:176 (-) Transcript_31851:20-547(-)